ncbi:MAG: DUF1579 family protein [Phycisphaerales bacterium]|nr:MAG: DUF1579 family protein [Phycisphaerales bacterium]
MKLRTVIGVVALGVALGVMASQVTSQEAAKKEEPKAEPKVPDQFGPEAFQAAMAEYAKWAAPGEPHKQMAKFVGTWDVVCRLCMDPTAPPTESKATATFKTILDGRFLVQEHKGELMGRPFEGMSIEGYDNFKKKYVSVWVDNMSSGIMTATGDCDPTGEVCTYYGVSDDPVTGEQDTMSKSVMRRINDDKFTFEMYQLMPNATEFSLFQMEYTRRK